MKYLHFRIRCMDVSEVWNGALSGIYGVKISGNKSLWMIFQRHVGGFCLGLCLVMSTWSNWLGVEHQALVLHNAKWLHFWVFQKIGGTPPSLTLNQVGSQNTPRTLADLIMKTYLQPRTFFSKSCSEELGIPLAKYQQKLIIFKEFFPSRVHSYPDSQSRQKKCLQQTLISWTKRRCCCFFNADSYTWNRLMLSNPVVFDYESCIQFADSLILREKSLFADRIFVSTEIFVALVGRVQLSVGNLSKRLRMVSRKQKSMSSEERSLPSPLGLDHPS